MVYPTVFGFFIYHQPLENIYNPFLSLVVFMVIVLLIILGIIKLMEIVFTIRDHDDGKWT